MRKRGYGLTKLMEIGPQPAAVLAWNRSLAFEDLPEAVIAQAKRCLLDLIGVAAAGSRSPNAVIAAELAQTQMAAGPGKPAARILLDGRPVSPAGAAYAGATAIDSFDAHDGHPLTKGHVGVAVLPALLAYAETADRPLSGRELLTCLAIGYEIAARAGIALHATAPDYHTSGAWNALACAALGVRLLGLDNAAAWHALGIAEYHGPRSQMMRCIDHPSMLKDGSGWGAHAGVSAAYLAQLGFTGAPALTLSQPEVAEIWGDLGQRWMILEQYFKPYPVCRWAQPAVEAALSLLRGDDSLTADAIERIEIVSFHEAVRLTTRRPASSDEAQYSLPYPVAAAVVRGQLGGAELEPEALKDPAILRLSESMVLSEADTHNARFPAERWAEAVFHLKDGRKLTSQPCTTRGDAATPLSDAELQEKYRALCVPVLGPQRSAAIESAVAALETQEASVLLALLFEAPGARAAASA